MKKETLKKLAQLLEDCAEITKEEREAIIETIIEKIKTKKRALHIIQEEFQGIPDDPIVFLYEEKADKRYLEIVKAYVREKNYCTVDIYSVQDALNFVSMMQDDDYILRYWKIEPED